jgi:hypothetical protein
MYIDDEIVGTEEMIAQDRANAVEVLARRATELKLDAKTLAHYKNFIDACVSNASSILATCRAIAAMPDLPPNVAKDVIEPFLLRAHGATHSMFLGMLVVEHLAEAAHGGSTQHIAAEAEAPQDEAQSEHLAEAAHGGSTQHTTTAAEAFKVEPQRICSFCGKTEAETPLVAGPACYICATCTRLAATIHGIGLAD